MLTNEQMVKLWSCAIKTAQAEGTNDVITFGRLVEKATKRDATDLPGFTTGRYEMESGDYERGAIVTDGSNTYEVVGCLESDELWWLKDVYTGEHTSRLCNKLSPAGPKDLKWLLNEDCFEEGRCSDCITPCPFRDREMIDATIAYWRAVNA